MTGTCFKLNAGSLSRMGVDIAGSPDAFQAEDEGSIPFTRSRSTQPAD